MNWQEMAQQVADAKEKADSLEAEWKASKKDRDQKEEAFINHLIEEGMASTKISGLGTFTRQSQDYYSVRKETKEETMAAMKEFQPELVQETINANTLSGFMREAVKEGMEIPAVINSGVSFYTKNWVRWTRE